MDPIAEIRTRLKKYPQARAEETPNSITVLPMDTTGFPVSLTTSGDEFIVGFAGWHDHFSSAEEALNCFAFGLSKECRLKVHKRGGLEHRGTVEYLSNGSWVENSTTGLLFFPFWGRREVLRYQNHLLPANRTIERDALQAARPSL